MDPGTVVASWNHLWVRLRGNLICFGPSNCGRLLTKTNICSGKHGTYAFVYIELLSIIHTIFNMLSINDLIRLN